MTEEKQKLNRTAIQWIIPIAVAAILILMPLALNSFLQGTTLGWSVVIGVAVASFVGSYADGKTYGDSFTMLLVSCGSFFITMLLYYNSGTWIYLIMVALLSVLGTYLGAPDKLANAKPTSAEESSSKLGSQQESAAQEPRSITEAEDDS